MTGKIGGKTKSKEFLVVSTFDLSIMALILLLIITVSAWLTIFISWGSDIELYKEKIGGIKTEINQYEKKIEDINSTVQRYVEKLNLLEDN